MTHGFEHPHLKTNALILRTDIHILGTNMFSLGSKLGSIIKIKHLKGKIFRVGHLGYINDRDIISVIAAIGTTLVEQNEISTSQAGEALRVAISQLETN